MLGSAVIGSTAGGSLALSLAGESALGGVVEADDESEVITTPS